MWYCNHCGPGDGFSLLMKKNGWAFAQAALETRKLSGTAKETVVSKQASDDQKRARLTKVWSGAAANSQSLMDYLSSRAINPSFSSDASLRWHNGLRCSDPDETAPAMLARYYKWGAEGVPCSCTIHRIWPSFKTKMVMPSPEKMDGVFCPIGGMPSTTLGVAEGVETALSVMTMMDGIGIDVYPVWATYSAEQMIRFRPPEGLLHLHIYMDVDYSYTGQHAAYELARRLRVSHPNLKTTLFRPCANDGVDWDFNDELMARKKASDSNHDK